jgi:asparagine synthase (glutamine-hydrolysing)
MCGIAGIVEYGATQRTITHELLKRMSDVIAHRGPDDEGHWMSRESGNGITAGFAFRRLAIIDLSPNGHQPMTTPDGRFTIVFNGEMYNHAQLRTELQQRGYTYRSGTDTETILYGYAEWGERVVSKMIGMWGLAIWDEERQELFCARDRVGIKPLYYTLQGGRFLFGSEIKSILQHPQISAEMNLSELTNYLGLSMTGRETLFAGIHKLRAGHWLKLRRGGALEVEEYWNPLQMYARGDSNQEIVAGSAMQRGDSMSETEIQQEIMRLLRQSVKDRMMSDVPFGVFLSGGIDSSTNVALMAELMERPVDTFSVAVGEHGRYNENYYARKVAKLFNTNHHEIEIDHNDAVQVMERLAWHEDEPNGDPVCIPLNFVSKLTREAGTIVVQVGEGSDEQFAGYSWMHRDLKFYHGAWQPYSALPAWMRRVAYGAARPAFMAQHQYLALDYLRRAAEGEQLYRGGAVDMTPVHLQTLLSPKFQYLAGQTDYAPTLFASAMHKEILSRKSNADYLQRMVYLEFAHRLPELLLMRVDKIGMAHGIEARVPFLDHRLVEFTMTIPERVKIPRYASNGYRGGGQTKHLLKKAVESVLPHEIIYRTKQGFAAPVSEWFRGPLKSYWEAEVLHSRLVNREGIFERGRLQRLFNAHVQGKRDFGKSLYALLNLALWHKQFIS